MAISFSKRIGIANVIKEHVETHYNEMEYNVMNSQLSVMVAPASSTQFVSVAPSEQFSVMATNIWTRSAVGKTSAADLISNIQNSSPQQCERSGFWDANISCGQHLSWEEWQPVLKTVASSLKREGVDDDAYMLFAKVFFAKIQGSDEQRRELFACIQPSHTKNAFLNQNSFVNKLFMNKTLEKQNTLLKKMNHTSVRDEIKRKFKG